MSTVQHAPAPQRRASKSSNGPNANATEGSGSGTAASGGGRGRGGRGGRGRGRGSSVSSTAKEKEVGGGSTSAEGTGSGKGTAVPIPKINTTTDTSTSSTAEASSPAPSSGSTRGTSGGRGRKRGSISSLSTSGVPSTPSTPTATTSHHAAPHSHIPRARVTSATSVTSIASRNSRTSQTSLPHPPRPNTPLQLGYDDKPLIMNPPSPRTRKVSTQSEGSATSASGAKSMSESVGGRRVRKSEEHATQKTPPHVGFGTGQQRNLSLSSSTHSNSLELPPSSPSLSAGRKRTISSSSTLSSRSSRSVNEDVGSLKNSLQRTPSAGIGVSGGVNGTESGRAETETLELPGAEEEESPITSPEASMDVEDPSILLPTNARDNNLQGDYDVSFPSLPVLEEPAEGEDDGGEQKGKEKDYEPDPEPEPEPGPDRPPSPQPPPVQIFSSSLEIPTPTTANHPVPIPVGEGESVPFPVPNEDVIPEESWPPLPSTAQEEESMLSPIDESDVLVLPVRPQTPLYERRRSPSPSPIIPPRRNLTPSPEPVQSPKSLVGPFLAPFEPDWSLLGGWNSGSPKEQKGSPLKDPEGYELEPPLEIDRQEESQEAEVEKVVEIEEVLQEKESEGENEMAGEEEWGRKSAKSMRAMEAIHKAEELLKKIEERPPVSPPPVHPATPAPPTDVIVPPPAEVSKEEWPTPGEMESAKERERNPPSTQELRKRDLGLSLHHVGSTRLPEPPSRTEILKRDLGLCLHHIGTVRLPAPPSRLQILKSHLGLEIGKVGLTHVDDERLRTLAGSIDCRVNEEADVVEEGEEEELIQELKDMEMLPIPDILEDILPTVPDLSTTLSAGTIIPSVNFPSFLEDIDITTTHPASVGTFAAYELSDIPQSVHPAAVISKISDEEHLEEDPHEVEHHAPSLTLSLVHARRTSPARRLLWAALSTVGINVILPFLNGLMLGAGEIFAREFLGIWFDWGPRSRSLIAAQTSGLQAGTSRIGLRGGDRSRGTTARSVGDAVVEEVKEVSEHVATE
ncbi:hypothetical protein BT69DRAFT_1330133 [Atractiella rhizophila]|nr:hypothetical protein BT69DRAFT_1330133 [Atractiella rhizophila]